MNTNEIEDYFLYHNVKPNKYITIDDMHVLLNDKYYPYDTYVTALNRFKTYEEAEEYMNSIQKEIDAITDDIRLYVNDIIVKPVAISIYDENVGKFVLATYVTDYYAIDWNDPDMIESLEETSEDEIDEGILKEANIINNEILPSLRKLGFRRIY